MSLSTRSWILAIALLSFAAPACVGDPSVPPEEHLGTAASPLVSTTLTEGFESGTKTSYAAGDVTFGSGTWTLTDALVGTSTSDPKTGTKAVRIRGTGNVRMAFDKPSGAETVTVSHARYGADPASTWELWYSTTGGQSWTRAGAPVTSAGTTLATATFTVHVDGPVRFEIRKTSGATTRIDVDDVTITGYVPAKLTVASWNVRDLSVASRDASEQARIADVIQRYDAVAVQEINDAQILDSIRGLLASRGGQWATVLSNKLGNSASTAEHYGVIYRTSRLHLTYTQQLPEVTTETGVAFDREPFVVGLGTNDGRFDFALLDVHVTWGTVAVNRIAEVKALKQYYALALPQERDVLVVGDFNRNANDSASVGWLATNTGLFTTTSPDVPTHISATNTYDQIMLNPAYTTEYAGVHGVFKHDEQLFGNDDALASLAASDHRPVWVELQPGVADDD